MAASSSVLKLKDELDTCQQTGCILLDCVTMHDHNGFEVHVSYEVWREHLCWTGVFSTRTDYEFEPEDYWDCNLFDDSHPTTCGGVGVCTECDLDAYEDSKVDAVPADDWSLHDAGYVPSTRAADKALRAKAHRADRRRSRYRQVQCHV